jgi:glycosyltransferase involved in cell wall biosynthesis
MSTVIYILDSLGLSGKTKLVAHLASHVDRKRFQPLVATLSPPDGILAAELRSHGVPVVHVPCDPGLRPSVVGRFVNLFRKTRADVVHCFNPRQMLYGGLAAATLSRPAIGTLSAFACIPGDREYPFLYQQFHTRSGRNRLRNRMVAHLMKRIATVSRAAGETFCKTNAIPQHKLRVIGYGVDIDKIQRVSPEQIRRVRTEVGAGESELLVGSVGRLVGQKDYPTQLRAFAMIAQRYPVRMVIAGGGPLDGELKALSHELGISDRLFWLGERTDIPVVLRALDAFVIASQFEPYGVSVLEAMAAGLPIISTDVNELPTILDHGRAGKLVPAEQPEPMARALEELICDREQRQRLGEAAHTVAQTRFSLRSTLASYEALYEEVMA